MMTDAMTMVAVLEALGALERRTGEAAAVPEPEFKPFKFPKHEDAAVRVAPLAPVNTAREPRTLEELGLPGTLARDLEAALRLMGNTRGERITGYTFRTPDGAAHALRTAPERTPAKKGDLAA